MATLMLYGSSVADATLTTACDMSNTTGGTETSKTTQMGGPNDYSEVWSKGSVSNVTSFTSIQAPLGNGWVYKPGAGTFATGNWSASITLSNANGPSAGSQYTVRFFRNSSGVYTTIGSIVANWISNTKQAYSFAATSMSSITFAANDLLYTDLWWFDPSSNSGDNPTVYESSSASQGVASDMQITTSNFTPSGGGATHLRIMDGYGGVFS